MTLRHQSLPGKFFLWRKRNQCQQRLELRRIPTQNCISRAFHCHPRLATSNRRTLYGTAAHNWKMTRGDRAKRQGRSNETIAGKRTRSRPSRSLIKRPVLVAFARLRRRCFRLRALARGVGRFRRSTGPAHAAPRRRFRPLALARGVRRFRRSTGPAHAAPRRRSSLIIRQGVTDIFTGIIAARDRDDDVLLAIDHISHG